MGRHHMLGLKVVTTAIMPLICMSVFYVQEDPNYAPDETTLLQDAEFRDLLVWWHG